jgi:O-antigen/teichoic acid export membrane protein
LKETLSRFSSPWSKAPKLPKLFGLDKLFLKNMTALSAVQAANLIAPMITIPYLLRALGVVTFGRLMLAQATVLYLSLFVEFGFNLSAARRIAEARSEGTPIGPYVSAVLGAKALLLIGGVLLLAVGTALAPALRDSRPTMVFFLPLAMGSIIFPEWLFRGLERMAVPSVCLLAARSASLVATFSWVHRPDDLPRAALIIALTPILAGGLCLGILTKSLKEPLAWPTLSGIRDALREGGHTFLSTAAVSLYSVTNTVLVGTICGPAQLAFFSTADKIRNASAAFIPPVTTAAYPRLVQTTTQSLKSGARLAGLIAAPLCGVGLVVGVMLFLFARPIVALVGGGHYAAAETPLRIMAALPLILAANSVLGLLVLLPRRMTRVFSWIVTGGGLVNLCLLPPLAYRYGATGAAISLGITETVVTAAMAVAVFPPPWHRQPGGAESVSDEI